GDEEGLREELFDLARTRDRGLVVFAELVHAEDRDDVLEVLVLLERLLDLARDVVVLFAENVRVEQRRRGVERIDGRVDALLRDLARKNGRRIEVRERRRRRGVGEVVGGDIDGLDAR